MRRVKKKKKKKKSSGSIQTIFVVVVVVVSFVLFFICAGVNFVVGCKWPALFCLSTNEKLLVCWQFSGTYDVTKYGSGWRKDVVNQCLEFIPTHHQSQPGQRGGNFVTGSVAASPRLWLLSGHPQCDQSIIETWVGITLKTSWAIIFQW